MKKIFTILLGIIIIFLTSMPVFANSAVRWWSSGISGGVYLVGDNPIDVLQEDLIFDLGYSNNSVSAEYTLYNSSDSDIEAELVFPIGIVNGEYEKSYRYYYPEVFLNDTKLDTTTRLVTLGEKTLLDAILSLKDEYVASDYDNMKFYKCTIDLNDYDPNKTYRIDVTKGADIGGLSQSNVTYISSTYQSSPIVDITYNLEAVPYTLEEVTQYEFIKERNKLKGLKGLYDCYSEVDLYNLFVTDKLSYNRIYAAVDYKIAIPAKSSVKNKVSTNIYPGINENYSPKTLPFEYYLSPASTFNSFKNLNIKINTNNIYLVSNNLGISKVNNQNYTYEKTYNELPDFNIELETCSVYEPEKIVDNSGMVYITIICIVLSIILLPFLIAMVIISSARKTLKNDIFILLDAVLMLVTLILMLINFAKYIIIPILFSLAGVIRLVVALIIKRKNYNKAGMIIELVCAGLEIALGVLSIFNYLSIPFWGLLVIYLFDFAYIIFVRKFYKIEKNSTDETVIDEEVIENKEKVDNEE